MNVFAEELGLPVNQLAACWEIILSGQTRGVDFAQNETNDRSVELHHFGGAGHRSPGAFIANPSSDGRQTEGRFILIGNGKYYGGKITFFKNGNNSDGLLDLLVFKNQSYLDIIRYLQGVFLGNHVVLA